MDHSNATELHREAMDLADQAFNRLTGEEAVYAFRAAYRLEIRAADLAVGLEPSHAILLRSAAGCALHGDLLEEAEDAARRALAERSDQRERHTAGSILAAALVPRYLRTVPVACGEALLLPAQVVADALQLEVAWVVESYGETLTCPVVDSYATAPEPKVGSRYIRDEPERAR